MAVILSFGDMHQLLQRQFGLAVEEVHAVLVELEPDLLVGLDIERRRQADVDDRSRQEHLHEGDVAGRLDRVDLRRHAPASTCDLCSRIVE